MHVRVNKVAGLRPATLLKRRLWHRCFPVNFSKFLRTSFFAEHFRWLLLRFADRPTHYFFWHVTSNTGILFWVFLPYFPVFKTIGSKADFQYFSIFEITKLFEFKGTVTQTEKALTKWSLVCSKSILKILHLNYL